MRSLRGKESSSDMPGKDCKRLRRIMKLLNTIWDGWRRAAALPLSFLAVVAVVQSRISRSLKGKISILHNMAKSERLR